MSKRNLITEGARLDALGGTQKEILDNALETNCFDISLDSPIFRVFEFDYFHRDLRNQVLTHCKPSPEAWGDDYEAFLSRVRFFISGYGGSNLSEGLVQYPLSIEPALDNFYALCWTSNLEESQLAWSDFSYEEPAIRIRSTPRKLLTRSITFDNKFFSLSHFIGKVKYMLDSEFEDLLTNTPYQEHLDSLGHGLAKSFFVLGESYKHENEVRLLYAHHPDKNDWALKNVNIDNRICSIPFNWCGAIEEIIIGPNGLTDNKLRAFKKTLSERKITVPIKYSKF